MHKAKTSSTSEVVTANAVRLLKQPVELTSKVLTSKNKVLTSTSHVLPMI